MALRWGKSSTKYASMPVQKPRARTEDLVIEEVGDEVLIYDSQHKSAHCLGVTAARVWRACDGNSDVSALSESLELSADVVAQAMDELEGLHLLEIHALNVIEAGGSNGNGSKNRNGITRRQLTSRSAKIGAGLITAPLVYSINVRPAFALLTPPPFVCLLFTGRSCGTATSCGRTQGCCCCCQGGGSCKICGSVSFCAAGTQPCEPGEPAGDTHCSSTGDLPADDRGCCGFTGADNCGCGFGTGGGCCDRNTHAPCTPSDTNPDCIPCCNNVPIGEGSQPGCCTTNTCIPKS